MSLKERLSPDTFVDDTGEVLPYADVAGDMDVVPPSNPSIVQGMANLEQIRRADDDIDRFELELRHQRERAVSAAALASAGPHDVIGEHHKTQLALLDAVADMSMYAGGERGGYRTRDFNDRYGAEAPRVETGARMNHRKLVNVTFPELLKASQLIEAGFDPDDVRDMVTETRLKMKRRFGGPENEKARGQLRARLKD